MVLYVLVTPSHLDKLYRSDSKEIEPVPWDVDTGRMNTGVLLGNSADLTVARWETTAKRRATTRAMFTAAVASLV